MHYYFFGIEGCVSKLWPVLLLLFLEEQPEQCVSAKPGSCCKVFLKSGELDLASYSKAICNRRLHLTSSLFLSSEGLLKVVV